MPPDNNFDDRTRGVDILGPGVQVHQYNIIKPLGAGGMGEVFLAEDSKLHRQVALKFLPAHLQEQSEYVDRFTREARVAASLDHQNVVSVYEVNEYNGRPFYAMQYLIGDTLSAYCAKESPSFPKIIELTIQILSGLRAVHEAGIVHRDLKPANIIISKDGWPVLVDFGLAYRSGDQKLTQVGTALGTIGYMSPEQINGNDVDHRSDLFAMGVILYEMLTGEVPFQGESQAASLHATVYERPTPVSQLNTKLPADSQRVIDQLLAKDPNKRYQSANDVIRELTEAQQTKTWKIQSGRKGFRVNLTYVYAALAVVVVAVGAMVLSNMFDRGTSHDFDRIMLAVLPFENLGSTEDEYFADGITEEILTNIGKLSGLGVIARSSAIKYKNSEKSAREIGRELGVQYILEGTIRWDKSSDPDRVRISPKLINVEDATQVWAQGFDEVLDDIFAVQAKIAQSVANKLDVTLLDREKEAISEPREVNTAAYDYYLRGNQYVSPSEKDLQIAIDMYRQATALEPDFALAHAKLGMAHTSMYWWRHDRTADRLQLAKTAIDQALHIDSTLVEARFALGWYYYQGLREYDKAMEVFEEVREEEPNNSELYKAMALVQRRQGEWDRSIENFEKARVLDPRDPNLKNEMAATLINLRRYAEAEALLNSAINLNPKLRLAYINKIFLYVLWQGDVQRSLGVLDNALAATGRNSLLTSIEIWLNQIEGNNQLALSIMLGPGREYAEDYDYFLTIGSLYKAMRDPRSQAYFDSARMVLENVVATNPDDYYGRLFLARAYIGLGRGEDATREAETAVDLFPLEKDEFASPEARVVLAEIYTAVGDYESAAEQLDLVLSIPSNFSIPLIKADPNFRPLIGRPEFAELERKFALED